jgi:Fe-S cluster biosynthesis and repair protein YggX
MKLSKEITTVLGLNKKEQRILDVLTEIPVSSSFLQLKTGLPRVTLDRILRSLLKRKLLVREKVSPKRYGWKSQNTLLFQMLDKVTAFSSREEMLLLVKNFIEQKAGKHIYSFQSPKAWQAWYKHTPNGYLDTLNNLLAKHKTIITVVTSANIDEDRVSKTYEKRPTLIKTIPQEFLPTSIDIEVGERETLIMNWEKPYAIRIEDEDIALFFKKIILYAKEKGDSYVIERGLEKGRKM